MAALGGIILVGGRSSRMGTDKALLPFAGTSLIRYLIDELRRATSDVLIVARDPEKLGPIPVPVFTDIDPQPCALSGVHAGLTHSAHRHNVVLACDLPLFQSSVVDLLAGCIDELTRVVVPHGKNGYESLCAIYSKDLLPKIESNLARGRLSLQDLYETKTTRTIPSTTIEGRVHKDVFFNMNTVEDYKTALRIFESAKKKKG